MSTSKFQAYNIDDLYDSILCFYVLFSSRKEPTFVMASQLTLWGFHSEHQVNIEKLHQRVVSSGGAPTPAGTSVFTMQT